MARTPLMGWDRHAWQKAICRSDLPGSARLVALAVSVYTGESGGQGVWLTSSDIAHLTGLSAVTTVNRYLGILEGSGWLRREDGARFLAWPGVLPLDFGSSPDPGGPDVTRPAPPGARA